jgi:hypothetical protein
LAETNTSTPFFFAAANYSSVSPDAFNLMMQNVDTKNEQQAYLAQQLLQAMVLGPPTTAPPIPTRTAGNVPSFGAPRGNRDPLTLILSRSECRSERQRQGRHHGDDDDRDDLLRGRRRRLLEVQARQGPAGPAGRIESVRKENSKRSRSKRHLDLALSSMLDTGSGVDSKAPEDVTNRFALALVAAKVLSGDAANADKWAAVDECFPYVSPTFPLYLGTSRLTSLYPCR